MKIKLLIGASMVVLTANSFAATIHPVSQACASVQAPAYSASADQPAKRLASIDEDRAMSERLR